MGSGESDVNWIRPVKREVGTVPDEFLGFQNQAPIDTARSPESKRGNSGKPRTKIRKEDK